ncbi:MULTISPECIES: hypothetical protein [Sorangium]|uniref:hypothetical protein n=1 Tax=Sorangium TaxID=39643 RepID=UPI0005D26D68|nr:hypothetical protein [Sorangium cellulosum]
MRIALADSPDACDGAATGVILPGRGLHALHAQRTNGIGVDQRAAVDRRDDAVHAEARRSS